MDITDEDTTYAALAAEKRGEIARATAAAVACGELSAYHMRTKCGVCGNSAFSPCDPKTDEQKAAYDETHLVYGRVFTSLAESCGRCDPELQKHEG
jgi:ribosomal protein S27AE